MSEVRQVSQNSANLLAQCNVSFLKRLGFEHRLSMVQIIASFFAKDSLARRKFITTNDSSILL
jgi:hypothetical protein